MFHKLVCDRVLILITQNTNNFYISYTNYYILTTTITKYFWIYLHPEIIIVFVATVLVGAPTTFGGA
jgi:hypothetical protein